MNLLYIIIAIVIFYYFFNNYVVSNNEEHLNININDQSYDRIYDYPYNLYNPYNYFGYYGYYGYYGYNRFLPKYLTQNRYLFLQPY